MEHQDKECKNVTSFLDQKYLVNQVLEKMSDEIKQKNISDQLEVRKICSRPEVKRRTPTTSNEQETKTSTLILSGCCLTIIRISDFWKN